MRTNPRGGQEVVKRRLEWLRGSMKGFYRHQRPSVPDVDAAGMRGLRSGSANHNLIQPIEVLPAAGTVDETLDFA